MDPKKAPMSDVVIKLLIAQGVAEHCLIMKLPEVEEMVMIAIIQEVEEGELCLLLGMPWKTLMKMMIDKYCPKSEIKKLEIEIWNLNVKGTYVVSYTQRFQELALMCGRMFPKEYDQIRTFAERQDENKIKLDDNTRNNQTQQQPFKRQNVARAYTARISEKNLYG
ncbi:reverse transcriptase domain-containing protein, partial [Tanacetum coccineum]